MQKSLRILIIFICRLFQDICKTLIKLFSFCTEIYIWSRLDLASYLTMDKQLKDFILEKQIALHFVQNSECPSNPPSRTCNSIINPFLDSRIPANHDKEKGF